MIKLKKVFGYFLFFKNFIGNKLFLLVLLSSLVAFLDGFGLAMFLPLLEMAGNSQQVGGSANMGALSFLTDGLKALGLDLTLQVILFTMLTLFLIKGSIQFVEGTFRAWLRMYFVRRIRFQMIDGVNAVKYQSFTSLDAGMIQNTISGEVWRIINAFNHYFTTFQSVILLSIYVFLAFLANPQFAILVALGGFLTNVVYSYIYKITKKLSKQVSTQGHIFQSLLIQSVQYFKYLKSTDAIKMLAGKLKLTINDLEKVQYRMGKLSALLSASREPMIIMVVVLVILFQVNYLGGQLATIILSLLFFYRSLSNLVNLQNAYNNFLNNVGALDNAKEFIDNLKNNAEPVNEGIQLNTIDNISVSDLSFSYQVESPLLKNISFNIKSKSTVAFVGESGSGKTTIVNLITGLLGNFEGSIKVGLNDIKDIDLKVYRSKIGYITQEAVIFTDTLFNNVTLWDQQSEDAISRFEKVVKQVALWDFYQQLSNGKDTLLGDYGQKVSGGQRQRISIARELYKNIDLLIMDEATAALDSETENIIQENIQALKGSFTMIIIAHRLSTIRDADTIYFVENGKLEASGDFKTLFNVSARFRKMVELQEL
jgi:subfamily B ATP-binding cassette protein MsbA